MKKWVIIDDCINSKSAIFEDVIDARSKDEAVEIAYSQWNSLSSYDQSLRNAFYVGYVEIDESGVANLDTMTNIVEVKRE